MVVLRRIALVCGAALAVIHLYYTQPVGSRPERVILVIAAVCLYNEVGRGLFTRLRAERLGTVANAQIVLDTLALTVLLHYYGSGFGSTGVVFFAPAFFVYGAVLPRLHVLGHVVATTFGLCMLGMAERSSSVPLYAVGFFALENHAEQNFLILSIVQFTAVNWFCSYLSHYLSSLLNKQEQRSRALLEMNEREGARVRALLEVAQHASVTRSVEELLRRVCDTTVALVGVPWAQIFLWDTERRCLRLAAARAPLGDLPAGEVDRYPAELQIVERLRAGEVVHLDGAAGQTLVPVCAGATARGAVATPMVSRGWFEGALFIGLDSEGSPELIELAQGIAHQTTLAMVNVRTMEQRQEDAEVSRLLLRLSQTLSACLDEEALWTLLVRSASKVLDLPWALAARFDERSGVFKIVAAHDLPTGTSLVDQRFEDCPVLRQLLSAREVVTGDDEGVAPFTLPRGAQLGRWLAIPLCRGGWVAGVLVAGRLHDWKDFSRRQIRLAEGLGHHASIALQNARLVADLEAADRLKLEFVSTMSHELRTPLNVIIGYTEMLHDGAAGRLSPGQLDLIGRLDARGRELLELVEATLQVGRLQAGRDTLEVSPIPLPDLIKALQASTAGLPRVRTVAFEWEVPAEARAAIQTDHAKLALIVRNLVSNAFKFTSKGQVVVRLAIQADALIIEVQDTGIGIDAKHLPIIFDMFRQVDGSETRRHDGVGLGLYIVKQSIGRLGGTVDVMSTVGRGSTFRVALPGVVRNDSRCAA